MCGAEDCTRCYGPNAGGMACDDCGYGADPDEMKEVGGVGENVCPGCYEEYEECHRCEERFHADELTEKYGQQYCEVCVEEV